MKKLLLLISMFVLNQTNAQQNLVLNPSFEDTTGPLSCNFYNQVNLPIANWGIGNYGTTDVFSITLQTSCSMYPLNSLVANQTPRTGNNYVGITNFFSPISEIREYIRGTLSEPLQIGVLYNIEFYVCLTTYATAGMNNIGLTFVNNSEPIYENTSPIILQPHVNYSGPPIIDRDNWTLMSFQYVPTTPDLDNFIIGNFFTLNQTDVQLLNPVPFGEVYLLIEDVLIYPAVVYFDILEEICQGDDLILPEISTNGISGTWSPSPNNQQTTNYTFIPDNPNYPPYEITIVVKPLLTPEFDPFGPYCDEIPNIMSLPSISNNGVEGVWSPVFNPNMTNTYTFTPNDNFCSEILEVKVIVDKTPKFDPIEPFCEIDESFSLPTISTNGISGTWYPEFDPFNSQTYTFTRDYGDCTQQVTLDIIVSPQLKFELFSYCKDDTYFIDLITNNFSFSEISDVRWLINNSSISETGNKINLSDYSNLLQEVNTIEIIFTDSNGCLHTKEIKVLGKDFCKIQKGISPNGDGLNEYFDLVSFGGVYLKIFNRYGSVVYEKSNYKNEWHGKSNSGKDLPSGTYFYYIKTKIGEEFTGYIQLTF